MSPELIVRVALRPFAVPFRHALRTSASAIGLRAGLFVMIETADGRRGHGEASPWGDAPLDEAAKTEAELARAGAGLLGRSPLEAWREGPVRPGHELAGPARCGLETALADLLARERGLALHAWLAAECGWESGTSPPAISVNALVDAEPAADVGRAVADLVGEGFRAVKIKVGAAPVEADLRRLRVARAEAGTGVELRADANRGWDPTAARRFLEGAAEHGLALCEEPLAYQGPGHFDALRELGAGTTVPIGLDESCRSVADLRAALTAGAGQALVLKPMASGLRSTMAMAKTAQDAGLSLVVTTTFDLAPGTALAAHLAAALPGPARAHGLATLPLLEDALALGGPWLEGGRLYFPPGEGLGVELDEAAFDRYALGPWRTVER